MFKTQLGYTHTGYGVLNPPTSHAEGGDPTASASDGTATEGRGGNAQKRFGENPVARWPGPEPRVKL